MDITNVTYYALTPDVPGYYGVDPGNVFDTWYESLLFERIHAEMRRSWPHANGDYVERMLPDNLPIPYPPYRDDVFVYRFWFPETSMRRLCREVNLDPGNVWSRAGVGAIDCIRLDLNPDTRDRLIRVAHIVGGVPEEMIVHLLRIRHLDDVSRAKAEIRRIVSAALNNWDRQLAVQDAVILADVGLGYNPTQEQQQRAIQALEAKQTYN